MSTTDSIIQAESGGDTNAKNPNSSASGAGQFLDSTWLDTLAKHRPDIQGSREQLLALKSDPALGVAMTDAYAKDNQGVLSQAGLPVTPGTTYLAHFAGPAGAVKVLQADPGADVGDLLGPTVVNANPFLRGMTAQGLQAWAAKKMGTAAPVPGVQPAATAPQPAAAPTPAAPPPPAAPIFAPQPAAAAPPSVPAASPLSPMFAPRPLAAPTAAPIFAQQQRPIDLSGLRNMLAARAAPIFPAS